MRSAGLALLGAADAAALVRLPGRLAEFVARVGHPRAWLLEAGADRALLVAAGAAVWLAAAWLGLGLLAALASRLPGAAGRLGAHIGRRMLPRALLGLAAGTAGIGVLLAPVAAGADPAPSPTPAISAPSWPLDPPAAANPVGPPTWPTSTAVPSAPVSPRAPAAPTSPAPPTSSRPPATVPPPPAPASGPVRVRPGDSLWLLAGRRLGPDPADAQIAAAWPRWYAANRAVIGDDPALISPGQVLRPPAPTAPSRKETR